LLIAGLC